MKKVAFRISFFISTSVGAWAQMYFVDFMVVVITVTNTLLT